MNNIINKISKLRETLILHRILYYVFNQPIITDAEYDFMENKLKVLCKTYPYEAKQAKYAEYCPSCVVGSCFKEDYPAELVRKAEGETWKNHV